MTDFKVTWDHNISSRCSSPFLFYDPAFLQTKPYSPECISMAFHEGTIKLYFRMENGVAHSLPGASFGGIAVQGKVSRLDVVTFYKQVFSLLRSHRVTTLKVTSFPSCYDTHIFQWQDDVFKSLKNKTICTETNAWLNACDRFQFRAQLHRSEKNKLNKAHKAGLVCEQLPGYTLPLAYKVVEKNRKASDYPVTMKEEALAKLLHLMPDAYRLFGVWLENTLVATGVCIQVLPDVLYTFYLADDHEYRQYSPTVLLVEYICDYAARMGCRIVDLGTASLNGEMNEGLFDFKAHLGAEFCPKRTYEVTL